MHTALPSKGLTAKVAAMLALAAMPTLVKAIAPIGDDSELFVTATAAVTVDDNIFLSNGSGPTVSDTSFDLTPGLSYEFGKTGSLTTGQAAINEDFEVFARHSRLNNDMFNGIFWTKYDDGKTKFNFDGSMHQFDQAVLGIQNTDQLVFRDVYHLDALGETDLTDKSSIGAGFVWDDTAYKTPGYADWTYEQVPLNFYYEYEPKLDFSAGVRFQNNTIGLAYPDSTDMFYNIGARGEFTPNLTGTLQVGIDDVNLRSGLGPLGVISTGGDHRAFGAASTFTYAYSPKTTVNFGINDNFGYGPTNGMYRDLGVYVGANTALTDQWSANGQIAWNRYSYLEYPLDEDFYTIRLGVGYTLNANVVFNANYQYEDNVASLSVWGFKQNLFTVSATAHF